jgi:hypothetical protein
VWDRSDARPGRLRPLIKAGLDCSSELWLDRGSYGDVVDLAFNRETERAQLWQPGVAIFVVNEREDADHPGLKIAGDARPSALVAPVDDIGSAVHSRVHMVAVAEAGCCDPNLNLPSHIESGRGRRGTPPTRTPQQNSSIVSWLLPASVLRSVEAFLR